MVIHYFKLKDEIRYKFRNILLQNINFNKGGMFSFFFLIHFVFNKRVRQRKHLRSSGPEVGIT